MDKKEEIKGIISTHEEQFLTEIETEAERLYYKYLDILGSRLTKFIGLKGEYYGGVFEIVKIIKYRPYGKSRDMNYLYIRFYCKNLTKKGELKKREPYVNLSFKEINKIYEE